MKTNRKSGIRALFFSLALPLITAGLTTSLHAADGSLLFDGNDDYVEVPNFQTLGVTNEVTVEFWALVNVTKDQSAFMLSPDNSNNRFLSHLNYSNGGTYWDFGDIGSGGRVAFPSPEFSVGSWKHYALVGSQAGNYMKIYVNGAEAATVSTYNVFETTTNYALRIGGSDGLFLDGKLDDFRIWNVARTATEILANFGKPLTGNETGLRLYFKFDEGTGSTAVNSATATGATRNGTLHGNPVWSTPALKTYTVTNNSSERSIEGSLGYAITAVGGGPGLITFAPALSGQTIPSSSVGNLIGERPSIIIDATSLPGGVTLSGNGWQRCFFKFGGGAFTLRGVTITSGWSGDSSNGGGGILVVNTSSLYMESCTVQGCTARGAGGGVWHSAQATFVNCTFIGNSANSGGAIHSEGPLTLRHCTINGNSGVARGGGVVARSSVKVENCIIAGNSGPAGGDINLETSSFTRAGRNFIGNNSSIETIFPAGNANANGDRVGTAAAPLDPGLAAATFNGGTGLTRLPLPGSPVINSALATADSPSTDQRGATRPQGSAPDLGAVEVEWGGNVTTAPPQLTGLWLFDNGSNLAQATVGTNLGIDGILPGWSGNQADNNQRVLSGVITTVGGFSNRLVATHGIAPNGGTYVNRYTILMDVLSPPASQSSWRSIFQTSTINANDAEYFIATDDRVGVSSIGYGPAINDSRWQRLVITVENGGSLRTYVNGVLTYVHSAASVDGRFSLNPQVLFFADGFGANAPLHVGAIAMWNGPLSAADIAALGNPGDPIPPAGQITTPLDQVTALPFASNPNGEDVTMAFDDLTTTKYYNQQNLNSGLEIVPVLGLTRLTGLRLTSANDVPGRDPASFTVIGRGGNQPWRPIAAGTVPAFTGRFVT